MAKEPKDMTEDELTVDLYKRPDSLDHLTAKAELDRRARVLVRRNSRLQLVAVIIAAVAAVASAVAATASAVSAYLNYVTPHYEYQIVRSIHPVRDVQDGVSANGLVEEYIQR